MVEDTVRHCIAAITVFLFSAPGFSQSVVTHSIGTAAGRDYSTITAWEAAQEGDLVTLNEIHKGECYNDSQFKEIVNIGGSTTDSTRYMWLTAALGESHNGTARTGVSLIKSQSGPMLNIFDAYTRLENMEILGASSQMVQVFGANSLLNRLILHDVFEGSILVILAGGDGTEVRNTILYDGNNIGVRAEVPTICRNVTVYKLRTSGRGFHVQGTTMTVINCIATGATIVAFGKFSGGSFSNESKNNLSDDGSAPGPNSLHFKSAEDQFVNLTVGEEDFHLKPGSDAINAGFDLSAEFRDDIDGETRRGLWDIGADEFIITTVPGVPTLVSPVDNATDLPHNVTFSWDILANAEWYRLQVSEDSAFTSLVFDDSTLTETEKEVGPLALATKYYWRVRGENSLGIGPWSEFRSFTVTELARPTLVSPVDGATGLPPNLIFSWNVVANAEKYRLQVSENFSFTSLVFDDSTLTETQKEVGHLALGIKHYWRVRAENFSKAGPWSEVRSFTVAAIYLTAPTLISPADGATGLPQKVECSWNAVPDAGRYRLQIARDTTFTSRSLVFDNGTLTETQREVGPLAPGTKYYWRVRAEKESTSGPWSEIWSFTTTTATSVDQVENEIPDKYELHQNYPNPFNAETIITYSLPSQTYVLLKIYNIVGREVRTLVNRETNAGVYRVRWDGRDNAGTVVSSGVYLYRMETTDFLQIKKMLFLQ